MESSDFTTEDVRCYWSLGDGQHDGLPAMTDAINTVARLLGRDWIDRYVDGTESYPGKGRGLVCLRSLARLGGLLGTAEHVTRFQTSILRRIRSSYGLKSLNVHNLLSAWSELRAIEPFLTSGCTAEFEPSVVVSGQINKPDFLVDRQGAVLYVEVTAPLGSVNQWHERIVCQWLSCSAPVPSGHKLALTLQERLTREQHAEVAGLIEVYGRLLFSPLPVPVQHLLAQLRISRDLVPGEGVEGTVRAFDDRASSKLPVELDQLPDDDPSLLVVDASANVGVSQDWPTFARDWLDDGHDAPGGPLCKPSAVWFLGEMITQDGPIRLQPPVLVQNPHGISFAESLRECLYRGARTIPIVTVPGRPPSAPAGALPS